MTTPGCFGFLRRGAHEERQLVERPQSRPAAHTPYDPKVHHPAHAAPAKAEHFEPCFQCSDGFMTLDKRDMDELPRYDGAEFKPEIRDTVKHAIAAHADELKALSLDISDHPELGFKEQHASKILTAYLEKQGFSVTLGWKDLPTAFWAEYTHGSGGRTFGFNSEYDALPGVGHACGHNLIAVAGVAAALGTAAAMKKHGLDGRVVLIGTPAEEGGVGKGILLERGGYDGVEACMMIHPTGIPSGTAGIVPTLAITTVQVDFYGRTSHAGGAPWDGINALDAVHLAYGAISAMRQQMHTTDRVHGIITRGGEAPNIIPDHTSMKFYVRAQSATGVDALVKKVTDCFDAAALATGCTAKHRTERMMYDLRNNLPLSTEYAAAMGAASLPVYVGIDDWSQSGGSTDFGNVTYAMPAAHPHYGIPSTPGRANHTVEFRDACRTDEAHALTWDFSGGMACVAARFLGDDKYAKEVTGWYDDNTKGR